MQAIGCTALFAVGSTINGCGSYNSDMDLCACIPDMQALLYREKQKCVYRFFRCSYS